MNKDRLINVAKDYLRCPKCGSIMRVREGFDLDTVVYYCTKCDYSRTRKDPHNVGIRIRGRYI